MRILFVSDLNDYSRGLQRFNTLKNLGHEILGIPTVPVPWRPREDFNFWEALTWRLRRPADLADTNKKITTSISEEKFDIIWIEKGNVVRPATLVLVRKKMPDAILISCSEDDMYGRHNRSKYYEKCLPFYDIVFTTKIYNLEELKYLGARRTELFLDAYDENLHQPIVLTEEEKRKFSCDVGFIGSYEEDRARQVLYLAEHGIKVVVWGLDWQKWIGRHPNLDIKNEHLYREDYSKAINATKINLCFLRKLNRDEVTSRSVEIPACGGFMLGERTKRHQEFFEEGREAEFFVSQEELLKKVRKFLNDDEGRKKIAEAGRIRCLQSGYSMREQLEKMLKKCSAMIK